MKTIPFIEVLTEKIDPVKKSRAPKVRLAVRGDLLCSNESNYSPVTSMIEERVFLALLIGLKWYYMQGDVASAYLYARLIEPYYFSLPQAHPEHGKGLVYKSEAAVYGLPESGAAWYSKFSTVLISFGFEMSKMSPGLFYKVQNDALIVVAIYVDDFLVGSSLESNLTWFKNKLLNEFRVKFTRELSKFIGLEINVTNSGFLLHQNTFITELQNIIELQIYQLILLLL